MTTCSSRNLCITSPLFWFPPASSYPKLCSPPTKKPPNKVDWGHPVERDRDTWLIHLLCPKECYTHTRHLTSPVEPCICRGYCTIFSELDKNEPSWPCVMSCSLEYRGGQNHRPRLTLPLSPPSTQLVEHEDHKGPSVDCPSSKDTFVDYEKRDLLQAWLDSIPEYYPLLDDQKYLDMPIWQETNSNPSPNRICPPPLTTTTRPKVALPKSAKRETFFGVVSQWVVRIKKGLSIELS
ncbi:hypothetical protein J3Q64DRAFT_1722583 [Phycomyces blakesleeanus]|uniref:Uncharacterized protein n=2 Tax=Phycomyces blakesleeanus TaxID=4837 RepID=A0A167NSA1_PHYB8|nr:hypothetical protein PHYBLDRAFT_165096 [Phycomyces blakesleeanus NRRL 1555(-)]OAD76568.1 hypothetical protein PHYBLDRAFT_165096 [Phycomyces blakesleeanus NRRL 1555(-)]|eukprot:XP_018294608.1 hypothetical protein PHYBLDRAFT_165096 [Phycomyces blakesleeanus NRRL 1555(-)]